MPLIPDALPALSRSALADTIQLAITPVFLLTAIGAFLAVMTTRLGRVIDRARALEDKVGAGLPDGHIRKELVSLDRRIRLANRAVSLSVGSALLLCLLIAFLFLWRLQPAWVAPMQPNSLLPMLFIAVLALLTASLFAFLLEVRIALKTVRVSAEILARKPEPAART
ncbi:MAG: DUF2721 domain-containing protein [Thermaurantiacus sp.]